VRRRRGLPLAVSFARGVTSSLRGSVRARCLAWLSRSGGRWLARLFHYLVVVFADVIFVRAHSFGSLIWYGQRIFFGDGVEGAALLLPVLLELILQGVCLLLCVILGVPETSSAVFVSLVGIPYVRRHVLVLMVFERVFVFFRWGCVMSVHIEISPSVVNVVTAA
jgi:hypothetical protein